MPLFTKTPYYWYSDSHYKHETVMRSITKYLKKSECLGVYLNSYQLALRPNDARLSVSAVLAAKADAFIKFIHHDDVIKWKHLPRYWHFARGIHRSPVSSPRKGQWRGAFMFLLIVWINGCAKNYEAGDLRRHHVHYDVTVMCYRWFCVALSTPIQYARRDLTKSRDI